VQSEQLAKAFNATVQASLHGLRELLPVLERERDALGGQDADQLAAVVNDKLARLKALEPSVTARDRLQKAAGHDAGMDGGSRLVEALGDAGLKAEWSELKQLAEQVARLNDVNGSIVAQSERATRSALEILTGRPRSDVTYSNLRRRSNAAAKHYLGKT
jgi:flagellar biosynthesis/type III secretory pathway chaperone